MRKTERDSEVVACGRAGGAPGLVVVFSQDAPALTSYRVEAGGLELGRELFPRDERISRRHARIRLLDGAFGVADLGSSNGTFVGGERIAGETWVHAPALVRTGRTVGLLVDDVRRFQQVDTSREAIVGPTLATHGRRSSARPAPAGTCS
jgi:pSer/pThr/pTyr-binding forkhead associated (FHA) protein